jgi:type IV fimbrial biogenesis protein FimT
MDRQNGVTLIELLIVLTLLGILLGAASGSWQSLTDRSRLAAGSNQIIGLIQLARSEAIGKAPALICASDTNCASFGVASGLTAVLDINDNGRFDAGDIEIASVRFDTDTRIRWRSFRNRPHLRLDVRGTVYHQNGHFMLCRGQQGQKVIVSWLGKLRSERHAPDC